jgi:hypothetical protein
MQHQWKNHGNVWRASIDEVVELIVQQEKPSKFKVSCYWMFGCETVPGSPYENLRSAQQSAENYAVVILRRALARVEESVYSRAVNIER